MNKELNWFERHINWTWTIVALVSRIIAVAYVESIIAYMLGWAMLIGISAWALWRKQRSGIWILIPFIVLFLKNKRIIKKETE